MFFLSQAHANGKQHARFSPYPGQIEADYQLPTSDEDSPSFATARQLSAVAGDLRVNQLLVAKRIMSLAWCSFRNGEGFRARVSERSLAIYLWGKRGDNSAAERRVSTIIKKMEGRLFRVERKQYDPKNRQLMVNYLWPTPAAVELFNNIPDVLSNRPSEANCPVAAESEAIADASDENRLQVLEKEECRKKEEACGRKTTEAETPRVSAVIETDGEEGKEGGEEKEERDVTAHAERPGEMLNDHSFPTSTHQPSAVDTKVSKLVAKYPHRTLLLAESVQAAEKDGASQHIILQALVATEAKDRADYASYFSATCKKMRQQGVVIDESEKSRLHGIAGGMARDRQFAEWEKEKRDYIRKRAMEAKHPSP